VAQELFSGGTALAVSGATTVRAAVFDAQPAATPLEAAKGSKGGKGSKGAKGGPVQEERPKAGSDKGGAAAQRAAGKTRAGTESMAPTTAARAAGGGGEDDSEVLVGVKAGGEAAGVGGDAVGEGEAAASNPWLSAGEKRQRPLGGTTDAHAAAGQQAAGGAARGKRGRGAEAEAEAEADASALLGGGAGGAARLAPRAGPAEEGARDEAPGGMIAAPSEGQRRLMRQAFAAADHLEVEFEAEKQQILDHAKPKEVAATPGWGGWGGDGTQKWEQAKRTVEVSFKRTQAARLSKAMSGEVRPEDRKDKDLAHVVRSTPPPPLGRLGTP